MLVQNVIILYTMNKPATTRGGIMEKRMKTHPDLVCYALDEKNRLSILDPDEKPREGTLGVEGFSMAHALQLALIELSYFEPYREFLRKHFDATNKELVESNKSAPNFNLDSATDAVIEQFSMSNAEATDLILFILDAGGLEQSAPRHELKENANNSVIAWSNRNSLKLGLQHGPTCQCNKCRDRRYRD